MHYALQRALRRRVAAYDTCAQSGKVPQLDASLLEISGSEYCSSFRLLLCDAEGPFCIPQAGRACGGREWASRGGNSPLQQFMTSRRQAQGVVPCTACGSKARKQGLDP